MKRLVPIGLLLSLTVAVNAALAGDARVGLILKPVNSPFWKSVRDGAEEAAGNFSDLHLSVRAPLRDINPDQQIQLIEDEIAAGAKVVVVAPVDEIQLMSALPEIESRGVRLVVLESDMPWPGKAAFVGPNNVMGGYEAASYIVNRLNGVGKVAIITGVLGHSQAIQRTNGAREAFRMNRGMKLVGVRSAGWDRYRAMTEMESLLTTIPDLDAVFCCDDEMALGALEAIQSAGANAFVVGFDATPEALKEIAEGRLAATIAQNSRNIGRLAVTAAYRLAIGKSVPPMLDSGLELVTRDNVDEYAAKQK